MSARARRPLLTLAERLLGTVAVALLLVAIVGTGLALDGREQSLRFDAEAAGVIGDVDAGIDELDALMTTLIGTHHADAGLEGDEGLAVVFEQLRARAPHIESIGRYGVVVGTERDGFARHMADSGLYAPRITAIDAAGHARERIAAERYYPVSLLEPMQPARLRLLGADLGTVAGLAEALDRVALTNEPLITTLPPHWPLGEALMLFRAAYLGNHVPVAATERLRQADGGYWLASSPARLLEAVGGGLERFDLTLHIEEGAGRRALVEHAATDPQALYLRSLRPRHLTEHRWPIGDGALVLTVATDSGVPARTLATLAAIALLMLLSLATGAAFVRNRRQQERERRDGQAVLDAEREKAERTLNAIDDAVIALDTAHRVLHLNPAAIRLLGGDRDAVLGTPLTEALAFRHDGDDTGAFDLEHALGELVGGGPRDLDLRPAALGAGDDRAGPDTDTVLRLTLTETRDERGEASGHLVVLRDISTERRLTRRLEFQANHDALTGCTNRRYFEVRLGELLDDMPASGRRHALCYIDLDQFKIVNDTCGHAAGDRLLQDLTDALHGLCRRGDVLSRLGGDEFGLLIVDADGEDARGVADKVFGFFQDYVFEHEGQTFAVRASIGFVPLDERCGGVGDVLAAADLACYAAKEGGRNALYVYTSDDETMAQRSSELHRLPELQRALAEDRFELHVQAVARIDAGHPEGDITHYEFLLRLSDEQGRPVTPFRIIEAAERYGLMREIDRWVIARALSMIAGTRDGPGRDCSFSINLSGQSAADPTLIGFIEGEYARHGIDPTRVWFELTETAAISHFSVAVELAERIRALGSKVALDDFGSGLSSFGYLKNIPVDVLKIDGQFVRSIVDNAVDRTIVNAIDEVGKSMGIVTVAEFVEDADIVAELIRIGVDYAQGYHIGKPMPLAEALAALERPPVRRAA